MSGRLGAADVVDYLRAVGFARDDWLPHVRTGAGRHGTFVVSSPDGNPRWYLKQFEFSYSGSNLFEREVSVASRAPWPAIAPAFVDDVAQIVVYQHAGTSLWNALCSGSPVHETAIGQTREAVKQLEVMPSKLTERPPSVVAQLAHGASAGVPSLGQRRVLALLRESAIATSTAALCADGWRNQVTVHGDLKLEHVLISDAGEVGIIDWELAGAGQRGWDLASILQSLMIQPLLEIAPWTRTHALLFQELVEDAKPALAEVAPMVALRLWQAALEWASNYRKLPRQIAAITQLGLNLAESPSSFDVLCADLATA